MILNSLRKRGIDGSVRVLLKRMKRCINSCCLEPASAVYRVTEDDPLEGARWFEDHNNFRHRDI